MGFRDLVLRKKIWPGGVGVGVGVGEHIEKDLIMFGRGESQYWRKEGSLSASIIPVLCLFYCPTLYL